MQQPTWSRYTTCFLDAAVVLVGNGMPSFSNVQRVFVSFTMLFGRFAEAAIIGSVAQLVANLNAAASRHQEREDIMNETVRYLNIPGALQARVRSARPARGWHG